MGRYVVGITGASGTTYTRRILSELLNSGHEVKCVVTESARVVLKVEEELILNGNIEADRPKLLDWIGTPMRGDALQLFDAKDVSANIASGSYKTDGMLIVPCSGGTLGRIANGISNGLLERAADVCLKERRKLVLLTREMPLSLIHLRNMLTLTEAGATIIPASPSFYHNPQTINDMVDEVASRVLNHIGVATRSYREWQGVHPDDSVSNQ